MDKFKRILRWLILNAGLGFIIYQGPMLNHTWALNVCGFMSIIHAFMVMITFIALHIKDDEKVRKAVEDMRGKGPSVPRWIDILVSCVFIFLFAAYDWWFYGFVVTAEIMATNLFYKTEKPEEHHEQ